MKTSFGGKWFNSQSNILPASTNLMTHYPFNQYSNFNHSAQSAQLSQPNYRNPPFQDNSYADQPGTQGRWNTGNWGDGSHNTQSMSNNLTPGIEVSSMNQFILHNYETPHEARKDNHKPPVNINNVMKDAQFAGQGVNQYPAPGSSQAYSDPKASYVDVEQQFPSYQNEETPTNPVEPLQQNTENVGDREFASPPSNQEEDFSESFPAMDFAQPLTNEQVVSTLQSEIDSSKEFLLQAVLALIENTKVGINEQRETNKEADISQNAQQLFYKTEELFYYSSVAAELEQTAAKKMEWTKKAVEQLKEIQENPLYSKEINNEQEKRDACERAGRFIGETTSRIVGLGLGFGAAVAVASLMIPPAMVLYGPMIVAGPVIVAGAGGAAAFMANKLGYKIADITLSNTTALAGSVLDWGKNGFRDWWNKDKQQVKALTTLKNQLLQDIEKAQAGFIEAKNQHDQVKVAKEPDTEKIKTLQSQMTEYLENLYINASVLKDLEGSIVGKRAAEKAAQEALEHWKQNASFMEKAAKKIGESDTWKSITETTPRNICEKLGVITGKIVGLAIAAGLGAAAAIAITSSIGAAATILYGPMAVVGITAVAGIAAGAVGYKIANPVATWSFKKVGQVADLAKNAIYEVGKFVVGTKNLVMDKGKYSGKVKREAGEGKEATEGVSSRT